MTKTFAQRAKTITNKYKLRLGDKFDKGDPLALAAMNAELEELQAEQEAVREIEFPTQGRLEYGGKIPQAQIKKGTKHELEHTSNKKEAKKIAMDHFKDHGPTYYTELQKLNLPEYVKGGKLPKYVNGGFSMSDLNEVGSTETFTPNGGEGSWITGDPNTAPSGTNTNTVDPFKSRVPWVGAASNMIGNLLMNRDIDLPEYEYEEFKPEKARANLVDYSRGREQTMRERDQAQSLITRNARGTGSQAGLMENIIAGATGTQREAGTAFNQSLENEGNVNAQIKNQVSQFNAAQTSQAARLNSQNKLYATQLGRENTIFKDNRRQNRIGAVTGAVAGYTKDRLAAGQYDQMVNMEMARNPNFNLNQADPTFWRRLAGITDPIEGINFTNTGDTLTS